VEKIKREWSLKNAAAGKIQESVRKHQEIKRKAEQKRLENKKKVELATQYGERLCRCQLCSKWVFSGWKGSELQQRYAAMEQKSNTAATKIQAAMRGHTTRQATESGTENVRRHVLQKPTVARLLPTTTVIKPLFTFRSK
jgi:hypothetical protein